MPISRRQFLKSSVAVSIGFAGLHRHLAWGNPALENSFGPLVRDPEGILDLPEGFSYRILSRAGDAMDDGLRVPGATDGMAAFPGPEGRVVLVRNHELRSGSREAGAFGDDNEALGKLPKEDLYDWGHGEMPGLGGTTTVVYNAQTGAVEREFLSLAGTAVNCAGGPTPWHSWVSCEETSQRIDEPIEKDHGYNFEVPATTKIRRAAPVPLKAMGRFRHEAIAVDPRSGIVYQTEDTGSSLLYNDIGSSLIYSDFGSSLIYSDTDYSLIYRFIPDAPGKLTAGRLQALAVIDHPSLDTRNWEKVLVRPSEPLAVRWVDIENVESPDNDLRFQGSDGKGCARFGRGEGMWYGREAIYFACTNGGRKKKGQIFRYQPSPDEGKVPGMLELFVEPNDGDLVDNADNLTVSPFGDLIVCEDNDRARGNNLVGITPAGQIYRFGHNRMNESEFSGATFSPDGEVLFVNIQYPGTTLAIYGPWAQRRS